MLVLQSLHHLILCYSPKPKQNPNRNPPLLLQFRTSHRRNLRYLENLGIITSTSPETLNRTLTAVDFLKSKGFSDQDFARLSFLAPSIFTSTNIDRNLDPIFSFLYDDLSASREQARELILRCPGLLTCNATYRLKPTHHFLRELGIKKNLNAPTNLNAHLLNTSIEKLKVKIEFFEDWGLRREEAGDICARYPAVFGYSVEDNLRPKVEYLVYEMKRNVEELKEFPRYFGFSVEKRIAPRHLHLKQRDVRIELKRMLLWSDEKFYV